MFIEICGSGVEIRAFSVLAAMDITERIERQGTQIQAGYIDVDLMLDILFEGLKCPGNTEADKRAWVEALCLVDVLKAITPIMNFNSDSIKGVHIPAALSPSSRPSTLKRRNLSIPDRQNGRGFMGGR